MSYISLLFLILCPEQKQLLGRFHSRKELQTPIVVQTGTAKVLFDKGLPTLSVLHIDLSILNTCGAKYNLTTSFLWEGKDTVQRCLAQQHGEGLDSHIACQIIILRP